MSSRLMSSRGSDVNDDPTGVIMDNIDEQLSRVRPKQQVRIRLVFITDIKSIWKL